jgi:hypothetical protein
MVKNLNNTSLNKTLVGNVVVAVEPGTISDSIGLR